MKNQTMIVLAALGALTGRPQQIRGKSATILLSFALLVGLAIPASAELAAGSQLRSLTGLWLPSFFGNSMVLQRDQPVPVWGWADSGDEITVAFAGQTKTVCAATNGAWRVTLDAMPASAKPRDMLVRSKNGNRQLKLENILIGDVWLLSGDFGAYWEMFSSANAAQELPAANHPALRLLQVWGKSSNEPLNDILGGWRVCTSENVRGFSALGYFYGRALNRELGVPIGVIDASYRYSEIQGWMPPAAFRMIPELSKLRYRMDSWDSTTMAGQKEFSATVSNVAKWLPLAEQAFHEGKPIPQQPLVPAPLTAIDLNYGSITELSLNYQGMIHPLIPMRIRGVVWSLGENGNFNFFHLQGLIQSWRQAWGQGDFPFYLELIPNRPSRGAPHPAQIDSMRDGQIKCLALPNTGVAVTFDVSDYLSDNRNRKDPAERLAQLALAKEYGRKLVYSGPSCKNHRIEGDRVVIGFDHVGGGLIVGDKRGLAPLVEVKDGALKGFAIAGADQKWHWADARIVGDTVEVRSGEVPVPVAVRYACGSDTAGANLYNRDGLPAVPFRTDAW